MKSETRETQGDGPFVFGKCELLNRLPNTKGPSPCVSPVFLRTFTFTPCKNVSDKIVIRGLITDDDAAIVFTDRGTPTEKIQEVYKEMTGFTILFA